MDAVAKGARIIKAPERLARLGVETLDDLFLLEAVKENEFAGRNNRRAEALTNGRLPEKFWAVFWPCRRDVYAVVDAVRRGAEAWRPVFGAARIHDRTNEE